MLQSEIGDNLYRKMYSFIMIIPSFVFVRLQEQIITKYSVYSVHICAIYSWFFVLKFIFDSQRLLPDASNARKLGTEHEDRAEGR